MAEGHVGNIDIFEGRKMFNFGIIQGRLTPSNGRGIQFFPFDNWREEFYVAKEIGLQEIEWIFDYERYEENPLWNETDRNEINKIFLETGVGVRSICFDYFMRRPFYKYGEGDRDAVYRENCQMAFKVIDSLSEIGGELLEVPMVDNSSLKTEEEHALAIKYIEEIAAYAEQRSIMIGLETDLAPGEFTRFLNKVKPYYIYANFDSGNSSGIGYNPNEEIPALGERIGNVHIKDRQYHGTTVALGTGNADFDAVFENLKKIGYRKSFILQAARGNDGQEKENIKQQLKFVKKYVEKSCL